MVGKNTIKIKIFMLYMKKEVILMKDNLARRNWGDSKQYSFCLYNEIIQYLFFIAIMLGLFGDCLILHLALHRPAIYNTCSDLGLIKSGAN
jgi:hypothetical protein